MLSKKEFIEKIELIYSIYNDCQSSFKLAIKEMEEVQKDIINGLNSQGMDLAKEDLDKRKFHYCGKMNANGILKPRASFTQGYRKGKLGITGYNIKFIGSICLVMIYQYWEDKYRQKIAKEKGINKDQLNSDLFGDIRHYRHSIIHNNGQATREIDKCKILKWYKENDEIIIDADKMDFLIDKIKQEIEQL